MEQNLIPAPFDGANLATEWINDVFDNSNAVTNGKMFVGFVEDAPVYCEIDNHCIYWRMPEHGWTYKAWNVLNERLRIMDNDNPDHLIVVYERDHSQSFILQKFYWIED